MSSLSPTRFINNDQLVCPNAPKKNIIVDYFNYKYSDTNVIKIINLRRLSCDDIQPTINEDVEPPHKKLCN